LTAFFPTIRTSDQNLAADRPKVGRLYPLLFRVAAFCPHEIRFSCIFPNPRDKTSRKSAINSLFALPDGRKKTAKRPLFVRNFFDPFAVFLRQSAFSRQ